MKFERIRHGMPDAGSRGVFNRRRSPRTAIALPASIVTMSDYTFFDMTDLSATGAKLSGRAMPPLGKTALLRADECQVLCKVVWIKDDECGVRFDELLSPRVLASLAAASEQVTIAVTDRPEHASEL